MDCRRIIECTAFRRLEHKTQVFALGRHDHFRTRLTHTLEVAQIARTLARGASWVAGGARPDVDLTEAIALAHDLGHPPFGHAGEQALDECMAPYGGFNHNAHSLRVVEHLEHPFPAFRGLNLTLGTLDGLAAHQSRYDTPVPVGDSGSAALEAQVVSLADRIAYNCHDLEDALGADLIEANDLDSLELWREACAVVSPANVRHVGAIRRAALDWIIDALLRDALSTLRLQAGSDRLVARLTLSPALEAKVAAVEEFLLRQVYRHEEILGYDREGQSKVRALFQVFVHDPAKLPDRFFRRIEGEGLHRTVCDYIAGMTDRYCEGEFRRLCG